MIRKHIHVVRMDAYKACIRAKAFLIRKMTETRGEGYLDMVMKILIVIVLGALILTILNAAMPGLFDNLIDKISDEVAGVSMP